MRINVKQVITQPNGRPFKTTVDVEATSGGAQTPIIEELTLAHVFLDALPLTIPGTPLSSLEMVKRSLLAHDIARAAMADGEFVLASDQIITLKQQIEILQQQRGYNVYACAAALVAIASDDFIGRV
jgi:hypothetical protein